MKTRNIILTVVILVIIVLAAIYLVSNHDIATSTNPVATSTSQYPMSISDGTITISYSDKVFGLATTRDQILVRTYIPPCNDDFSYCFYYIGNAYVGTNFESAGIRVEKRSDLKDENSCLVTPPTGFDASMKPDVASSTTSHSWSFFSNVGDAAAGHYAVGSLYRLYVPSANPTCYEFETRIGETQFANYPAGAIKEFTPADEALLKGILKEMIDNIALPGGEKGLFI